jgi:hypothetical protein
VDGTLQIETDRLLVVGAVVNLLRNAFKFSPPGNTIGLRTSEIAGGESASRSKTNAAAFPRR